MTGICIDLRFFFFFKLFSGSRKSWVIFFTFSNLFFHPPCSIRIYTNIALCNKLSFVSLNNSEPNLYHRSLSQFCHPFTNYLPSEGLMSNRFSRMTFFISLYFYRNFNITCSYYFKLSHCSRVLFMILSVFVCRTTSLTSLYFICECLAFF